MNDNFKRNKEALNELINSGKSRIFLLNFSKPEKENMEKAICF
jgi:hypothetical protein